MMTKKNLTIGIAVLVGILLLIGVLAAFGVINIPKFGKEPAIEEPDANLLTTRNAYDIGLLRAREWRQDAQLARITSAEGATGASGRSNDWDMLFVSKILKGTGFHIVLSGRNVVKAEEMPYVGVGSDLPENVVSSQEAIAQVRQIKGYENEKIISVEMIAAADSKNWYWGVKTAKGVVTIVATR